MKCMVIIFVKDVCTMCVCTFCIKMKFYKIRDIVGVASYGKLSFVCLVLTGHDNATRKNDGSYSLPVSWLVIDNSPVKMNCLL